MGSNPPPTVRDGASKLEAYGVLDWLCPASSLGILEWIQQNVNLSADSTSAAEGFVDLDECPHLIEPLLAWADGSVRKITCMGPEQTLKSCSWQWGLLWAMANAPGPTGIVWRNDDEAKDMFQDRMLPLMRELPKLRRALDRPKSCKKDRYDLDDMVLYNMGAGSPILSKPMRYVIGDECDFWSTANRAATNSKAKEKGKNVSNIENMDKRVRTYAHASKRVLSCSPTRKSGEIYRQYRESSRASRRVACLNEECGHKTISHWFSCFKFQRDDDGEVIADSIRWVCPKCGHRHKEADKREMNRRGDYLHKHAGRTDHKGYQWSAMAAHWITWLSICKAIIKGGKNGNIEDQLLLDNSYKGIPHEPRVNAMEEREKLMHRCRPVPKGKIICVMMTVDTQDLGYWWLVRGIDEDGNTHRIGHGYLHTEEELEDLYLNREFAGRLCRFMLIDRGGHRAVDIDRLVCRLPNAYCYHGRGSNAQALIAWSSQVHRCILANANIFAHRLLFRLWLHANEASGYWYLGDAETMDDTYKEHLLSWGPPAGKQKADVSEWGLLHDRNHLFDCEKMWMVLAEEFREIIQAEWKREKEAGGQKQPENKNESSGESWGFAGGSDFVTGWQ